MQSPQLLTRLRRREIDGIVVKNVYDRATCEALRVALEAGRHDLIKTEFPAKFAAFFYGINLNLAHPDLKDYFAEAPRFRDGLSRLLPGELDLQRRITGLFAALDVRTNGQSPPPVAITSGGSATAAAAAASEVDGSVSAVARAGNSAAATNAVAREIVSPDDVIRAIKSGEIAIKQTDGAAADRNSLADRVWLFDEAQGSFVPPSAEQLTIVIDRDEGHAPLPVQSAEELGLVATAAMVTSEPTWLGTLRQFGRKAVQVVQQGTRWMQ